MKASKNKHAFKKRFKFKKIKFLNKFKRTQEKRKTEEWVGSKIEKTIYWYLTKLTITLNINSLNIQVKCRIIVYKNHMQSIQNQFQT